ncbi:MAG TPA: ABC transporter substrate-binding protein [Candidatus Binatia bacterium]|nr:ABC transporter substrate-binding protein [Candidatus Binatia bacterium]
MRVRVIGLLLSRMCFALCLFSAILLALCSIAEAQQAGKMPRIGYVAPLSRAAESTRIEAFKRGLQDFGYVEGKNIQVEYRYAEGSSDRLPALVSDLVQLKLDVLVAEGLTTTRAAKDATTTIPIVMVTANDPVATGIVDSLARPGGNITGLTRLTRDLSGKRLELLKEAIPGISRVGVLWDADNANAATGFKEYEAAAPTLKAKLQSLGVRGPTPDLEGAFQAAAKGRVHALIVILNPVIRRYSKEIANLAIRNRLPSIYEVSSFVEAGGLMSYSSNDTENFRRAAYYVDRILRGSKPADLPVEQPTKFELVINLKTAKQIGLTIPQSVLYRADKVIK